MHSSNIEAIVASQHIEERIRHAEAARQARAARSQDRPATRGRRWHGRSRTVVVSTKALHPGR